MSSQRIIYFVKSKIEPNFTISYVITSSKLREAVVRCAIELDLLHGVPYWELPVAYSYLLENPYVNHVYCYGIG